eukprot:5362368-Lingulodinium_polyedra.AAC.1
MATALSECQCGRKAPLLPARHVEDQLMNSASCSSCSAARHAAATQRPADVSGRSAGTQARDPAPET